MNIFSFFRPRLTCFKVSPKPIAGRISYITVRSRCASWANLHVTQNDGNHVFGGGIAPNGRTLITPTSGARIEADLQLGPWAICENVVEPRQYTFSFAPKVINPKLFVFVWPWAWVGHEILILWFAASTDKTEIEIEHDGVIQKRPEAKSGAVVFRPSAPGRTIIRVRAINAFGQTEKAKVVRVRQRKPKVWVAQPTQGGRPGTVVTFSWWSRNTQRMWVEGGGERKAVPLKGSFEVMVTNYREEFRLVAEGHGGTSITALAAVPALSLAD